jgi:LysM repeat protein
MQRSFISILLVFISCFAIAQSNTAPATHVVVKGETLYSIARLYHITVDALEVANKPAIGADNKIKIGQNLIIPAPSAQAPAVKTVTTAPATVKPQSNPTPQPANAPTASGASVHIVQKGETVYAISRATGLTWRQIKDANHLSDDMKLALGQKLIIPSRNAGAINIPAPKPGPASTPKPEPSGKLTDQGKSYLSSESPVTKKEPARQETIAPAIQVEPKTVPAPVKAEEPKPNRPEEKPTPVVPAEPVKPAPAAIRNENIAPADYSAVFIRYSNSGRKKVVYRGIGMFMQTENPGNQFLALYNYADMGAILKVTNLMSKHTIYVKVIGKVPATDAQNDVILKVSSEAADKLKVSEDKFLVEITGFNKE